MQPSHHTSLIYLHLSVVLFGFSGLFVVFSQLPAWQLVAFRTLLAAFFLGLISFGLKKQVNATGHSGGGWSMFGCGVLLAAHWCCFFYAIELSSVALGLITFASFPLFVLLIERFYFQTTLDNTHSLSLVFIILGLGLIVSPRALTTITPWAVCFGVLAGLSFAVLSLINRQLLRHYHPLRLAGGQNAVAGLSLLPWLYAYWQPPSLNQWFFVIALGLFCTAIAHALFVSSLKHIPVRTASLIICLEPIYGILLAWIFFSQWPSLWVSLGGLSILTGVFLAHWPQQAASANDPIETHH